MRKATLVALGAVVCAVAGYGGTASIVASFRSPCSVAYGIDYYDGYLYHAGLGTPSQIYKTDRFGSIKEILPNPDATGIDRTPTHFWVCARSRIYLLETNGEIVRYFNGPGSVPRGIAYGGGFLWHSNGYYVYKLRTADGAIINSFGAPAPCAAVAGVFWEAGQLWLAGWACNLIFKTTETGSVIESFSLGSIKRPYGITREGEYVWITAEEYVYKMKISPTAVEPASLGKVKALWR